MPAKMKSIHIPMPPNALFTNLNAKHTFDQYVVNTSDGFAYAAAKAVADNAPYLYNPLLLYGTKGLGKTHLLHAIGLSILTKSPGMNVCCCTAENFITELLKVPCAKTEQFRDCFRELDVLLVDDIQLLDGKSQVQKEFFEIVDELCGANKQVVITSNLFPRELQNFDEQLRSFFESGLIADIQPPDTETLIIIQKIKAELAESAMKTGTI